MGAAQALDEKQRLANNNQPALCDTDNVFSSSKRAHAGPLRQSGQHTGHCQLAKGAQGPQTPAYGVHGMGDPSAVDRDARGKKREERGRGEVLDEAGGQPQVVTPKANTMMSELSVLFWRDFCLDCCKPEALKTCGFIVPAENFAHCNSDFHKAQ